MFSHGAHRKPLHPYLPPASLLGGWRRHALFALVAVLTAAVAGPGPGLLVGALYLLYLGGRAVVVAHRDDIARVLVAERPRTTDVPDGFVVEAVPGAERATAEAIASVTGLEVRVIGDSGKIAVANDPERDDDWAALVELMAALPGVRRITPMYRSEEVAGTPRYVARDADSSTRH